MAEQAAIWGVGSVVLMLAFTVLSYGVVFGPPWLQDQGPRLLQGVMIVAMSVATALATWRAIAARRDPDRTDLERTFAMITAVLLWLFAIPIIAFLLWIMISGFSLADAIMDWAG